MKGYLPIFQMLSKTALCIRYHWNPFEQDAWCIRNEFRLYLDRQIPTTKQQTLSKGVGVAKFDFTNTFRNQLFLRVRVLYHQYSIINDSESILKSKIMSILTIIFVVVFLSDLLRNILSATVVHIQPWWQCIYLVQYHAAMYYNHSSMRNKVHLVNSHVVYVYWIDTVYVPNNLSTELKKGQFS